MMSITAPLPLKFECGTCHKIYMHLDQYATFRDYPCCPHCAVRGRLLGSADPIDLLKHPKSFVKSYFNVTLQMLGKTR